MRAGKAIPRWDNWHFSPGIAHASHTGCERCIVSTEQYHQCQCSSNSMLSMPVCTNLVRYEVLQGHGQCTSDTTYTHLFVQTLSGMRSCRDTDNAHLTWHTHNTGGLNMGTTLCPQSDVIFGSRQEMEHIVDHAYQCVSEWGVIPLSGILLCIWHAIKLLC